MNPAIPYLKASTIDGVRRFALAAAIVAMAIGGLCVLGWAFKLQFLIGGTPEDFGALIGGEAAKWAPVIKKVGLKVD